MKKFLPLFLIFLFAFFVRIWHISSVPLGFHNDEVDVAYVGKFTLLNGHDPAGHFLPLYFDKFGDFRPTGLFYLAGVSELIFGTNEFAARFPTVLFGALTAFPVYFLALFLFKKKSIGLLAVFFLPFFLFFYKFLGVGIEVL